MRLTNVWMQHPSRLRRCPTRCTDPAWTNASNAAKGGAPPPPTIMAIATALPRLLMAAAAPAMTWLPLNVVIDDNDRREVTARAHIARARLGLVLRRCPEIPPEHMQGGSRCPGPAVEPERARWHVQSSEFIRANQQQTD